MGSVEAPLSLNGGCIADDIIPHYLRPSTGSCHDICKYGRRRASDDSSVDAMKANKPSPDAKSFSSRPKNHSNLPSKRRCASSKTVKRGGVVSLPVKVQVQEKENNDSAGKRRCQQSVKSSASVRPKPVMVKLSVSCESSDIVHGKRRRNNGVLNGRNTGASMPSAKKEWGNAGAPLSPKGRKTQGVESKDRRMVKRVRTDSTSTFQSEDNQENEVEIGNAHHVEENKIKNPRMEAESNEFEHVTDAPSTSSPEEADKLISDTTMSQRNRNHYKRKRRNRVVVRPTRIKFRVGNQMHLHKEDSSPARHKLRRTRSKEDVSGSVSDSNKSARIMPLRASRSRGSKTSKNRGRRVKCGKTRVLVLDNRVEDLRRKYEKEDNAGAVVLSRRNKLKHQEPLQSRKDVQFLFSYVVEETVSKLAERRKGMVKSLVGVFESLISLQACSRFVRVTS